MSPFNPFSIGLSALNAYRQGINTTGYNIANASTPGFSRRRVHLSATYVSGYPGGEVATGVRAEVRTARDPFLDFAIRREMTRLGGDQTGLQLLSALEASFGTVENGAVQSDLSRLFDSLQGLASDPTSLSGRNEVLGAAESLARSIRSLDDDLVSAQEDADRRLRASVDDFNKALERVDELNRAIVAAESAGPQAGTLRDERALILEDLSSKLDVEIIEDNEGRTLLALSNTGDTLLSATGPRLLSLDTTADGFSFITASRSGIDFDLTATISGSGEIGALLATRDETIGGYRASLDQLAETIATEFNTLLATGFDLDGQPGAQLFDAVSGSGSASNFRLSSGIAGQPRLLGLSSSATEPGDGGVLQQLIDLRSEDLAALGGQTLVEFTADFFAEAGRDLVTADAQYAASLTIVDSLSERRASANAVSLDEEAANLLIWQNSFQAAARFLETINEVTDIAVNLGR